jgi:hypothetical protein
VTSTCFLQSTKNSNGFSWVTRTSFFGYFERSGCTKIEYHISALGAPSSKSKWRQRKLLQMINNSYTYMSSAHLHQTGLRHVLVDQTLSRDTIKVHLIF